MFNDSGFAFAGESITGLVRKRNEDNFLIAAPAARRSALVVVADGVGGHRHGEIVSYISCRELGAAFKRLPDSELCSREQAEDFFLKNLKEINERVFQINYDEFSLHPMSSTLVAVLFIPGYAVMANVGDSRFYQLNREGRLKQISTDHTLVNEGHCGAFRDYFPAMASNVISRSIGVRFNLKVEIKTVPLIGGRRFLLCSDGVYRDVADDTLEKIMKTASSPQQAVNQIMRTTLLKGAHDNTTVVTVFPRDEETYSADYI